MSAQRNIMRENLGSLIKKSTEDVQLAPKSGRPPKGSVSSWPEERNYRTTIVLDKEQHQSLKRLANKSGASFKEVMYLLLSEGLKRVESGDLVIENRID